MPDSKTDSKPDSDKRLVEAMQALVDAIIPRAVQDDKKSLATVIVTTVVEQTPFGHAKYSVEVKDSREPFEKATLRGVVMFDGAGGAIRIGPWRDATPNQIYEMLRQRQQKMFSQHCWYESKPQELKLCWQDNTISWVPQGIWNTPYVPPLSTGGDKELSQEPPTIISFEGACNDMGTEDRVHRRRDGLCGKDSEQRGSGASNHEDDRSDSSRGGS